jgi:hypothetical protein
MVEQESTGELRRATAKSKGDGSDMPLLPQHGIVLIRDPLEVKRAASLQPLGSETRGVSSVVRGPERCKREIKWRR